MNSTAKPSSAKRSLRILYVDDMRELCDVARIVLAHEGHTVECVVDGYFALQRIIADPSSIDLIITDHHMPCMNGLELVTRLRTLPYHGKIVVFSSELRTEVDDAYRKLNVDKIFPKPIFPTELREMLEHL